MRLLIFFLIAFTSSCATTASDKYEVMYYPDGVDKHDGMSAELSLQRRTFRIASDLLAISNCSAKEMRTCFTSDYMTFAYPAEAKASWEAANLKFEKIGSIPSNGLGAPIDVIRSVQRHGIFLLYHSAGSGLIGWDVAYVAPDGGPATERYRIPGLGEVRWPQSNNSFKGMPLRGTP